MGEMIRASDAERDAVVARLGTAVTQGRLTLAEFDERCEAALVATHRADLETLTADMPPEDHAAVADARTGALTPAPAAVPGRHSSVFGDIERTGSWVVPARAAWSTTFGDVRLDLRHARVQGEDVHLDVRTVFGDVTLLVPPGVEVDVQTSTVLGDVRQSVGEPRPGTPRIVLTGRTLFGDVRVRDQPRRARWRRRRDLPQREG